ncbi:MAG: double-strand break repair protein AddB [Hyphomicrobiales bacterium]
MNVYTIPPDADFLKTLARAVLSGDFPVVGHGRPVPEDLARWRIYLPTRRAQDALERAFLAESASDALLLPRIVALGEVDDLVDDLPGDGLEDLEPVRPFERRFILAQMIDHWAGRFPQTALAQTTRASAAQALALADALGRLIDGFEIGDVPLTRMAELLEFETPEHLAEAIAFLQIVRDEYPRRLAARGRIGAYDHQRRTLTRLARLFEEQPPTHPVIAAGSTGSMPATATLLKAIALCANGAVVLPGLDRTLEEPAWQALEPQDAQYGLKELLARFAIDRSAVKDIPADRRPGGAERAFVLGETLRPAQTTDAWAGVTRRDAERLNQGCEGVRLFEAPDQRTESLAIALRMREALETPGRTAALVTPDRKLAMRVAAELRRWSINVEDSAGVPLSHTAPGLLAVLLARALGPNAEAHDLLALLRHPLLAIARSPEWLMRTVGRFEIAVLRGPRQAIDPASLRRRVEQARHPADDDHVHRLVKALSDRDWDDLAKLAELVEQSFGPLHAALAPQGQRSLDRLLDVHREAFCAAAGIVSGHTRATWDYRTGDRVLALFDTLREHAGLAPALSGVDYADFFADVAHQEIVRLPGTTHPRLKILGLLEARLVRSDVTILGGLNEGIWPGQPKPEPWMSRPEKRKLGLQLPERRIGLMAHDFAQNAAGPEVWLTWSRKVGGQPSLPSRFVQRLTMLIGKDRSGALQDRTLAALVALCNRVGDHSPAPVPKPSPPVDKRPRRLSVSAVNDLLKDPYGFYAKRILKLRALEPLAREPNYADRGNLVHAIADRYARAIALTPDADGVALFRRLATEVVSHMPADPTTFAFLTEQLSRMARWFVAFDREARTGALATFTEVDGAMTVNDGDPGHATVTARADRIDLFSDGVSIVDYKTGSIPSTSDKAEQFHPQLLLEALIAQDGGFENVPKAPVKAATHVRLTGRDVEGEVKEVEELARKLATTRNGIANLLKAYAASDQAYNAVVPKEGAVTSDYELLSRWREWSFELDPPEGPGTSADSNAGGEDEP